MTLKQFNDTLDECIMLAECIQDKEKEEARKRLAENGTKNDLAILLSGDSRLLYLLRAVKNEINERGVSG